MSAANFEIQQVNMMDCWMRRRTDMWYGKNSTMLIIDAKN